jgi:hypothetical protein
MHRSAQTRADAEKAPEVSIIPWSTRREEAPRTRDSVRASLFRSPDDLQASLRVRKSQQIECEKDGQATRSEPSGANLRVDFGAIVYPQKREHNLCIVNQRKLPSSSLLMQMQSELSPSQTTQSRLSFFMAVVRLELSAYPHDHSVRFLANLGDGAELAVTGGAAGRHGHLRPHFRKLQFATVVLHADSPPRPELYAVSRP